MILGINQSLERTLGVGNSDMLESIEGLNNSGRSANK